MAEVYAPQPGVNGKIYRNMNPTPVSSPVVLAPVYTRIVANVGDVEIQKSFTSVDVTKRLGGGVNQYEPGNLELGFTLNMLHGPGNDPDVAAFINAFWTKTHVELVLLDQEIVAGAQGVGGPFKIFTDPDKQPIDGMMEHGFEFKPCFHPLVRAGRIVF